MWEVIGLNTSILFGECGRFHVISSGEIVIFYDTLLLFSVSLLASMTNVACKGLHITFCEKIVSLILVSCSCCQLTV